MATSTRRSIRHRGAASAIERTALETILAAARRPRTAGPSAATRFVIYTSGIWILGRTTDPATEETPINPIEHVAWLPGQEQLVLDAGGDSLRAVVVRPGVRLRRRDRRDLRPVRGGEQRPRPRRGRWQQSLAARLRSRSRRSLRSPGRA